jgi:hypothetical protein
MPQGYIKEATYQFSELYLPGKDGIHLGWRRPGLDRGLGKSQNSVIRWESELQSIFSAC